MAGGATKLLLHILLVQFLDRLPIKAKLLGNIADGRTPAAFYDIHRKTLGVERIVRQKVKALLLHLAATPAFDAAYLKFQKYPRIAGREVAHTALLTIIKTPVGYSTRWICCFFGCALA